MKRNFIAHLALFIVALIYGANYVVTKGVFNGGFIPPLAFIFFRVLCGMIFFQFINIFFIREKIDKKDWPRIMLCGLLGVAINQMFFFMGLEHTSPIHASLILLTNPFVVLIAGIFILGARITSRKLMGICLGALGAALLILKNANSITGESYLWGDFLVFINAVSYALYLVLAKPLMVKYHPLTIMAWVFTFAAFIVLPIGSFYLSAIDWHRFVPSTWMAFGYVLLFTTILAYLLNAFALKKVSSATASSYIYLQPLIAGSISILVGQDQLHWSMLVSTLLIFIGVYLVSAPTKLVK